MKRRAGAGGGSKRDDAPYDDGDGESATADGTGGAMKVALLVGAAVWAVAMYFVVSKILAAQPGPHSLLGRLLGDRSSKADAAAGSPSRRVFTPEELKAEGHGVVPGSKVMIAILGEVFDVSKGRHHYEAGASYHCFAGRDGSKAFVTGAFEVIPRAPPPPGQCPRPSATPPNLESLRISRALPADAVACMWFRGRG